MGCQCLGELGWVIPDPTVGVVGEQVLCQHRCVLLFGEPGTGKSSLAAALASWLADAHHMLHCLSADPGSPAFGAPGALSLGRWRSGGWEVVAQRALCTLDAARFRLPLVAAARALAALAKNGTLVVDSPGVVRGAAGAELLSALVEATGVDAVVVLVRGDRAPPLAAELRAVGLPVYRLRSAPGAHRPSKPDRERARTRLWDAHLSGATAHRLELSDIHLTGTPPPLAIAHAWRGRQVALFGKGSGQALGEVIALEPDHLLLRLPAVPESPQGLLVRDAIRGEDGLLRTALPPGKPTSAAATVSETALQAPRGVADVPLSFRVGGITATLVNGLFGDALVYLRLVHRRRSLLFDLGDAARLPARLAHQVGAAFVSHAHFDHVAGMPWLLRFRIGELPTCRLYGPPGLAAHIQGNVDAIEWDRVADRGPRFEVGELHGTLLQRFLVQAGAPAPVSLESVTVADGILLSEPEFRVRAVTLDHGIPVLAFAFEESTALHVRKERLLRRKLPTGPWLGELKRQVAAGRPEAPIRLPSGVVRAAGELAAELLLVTPGAKLAYATDLADNPANRESLQALAQGAHTLVCEAPFLQDDLDQARRTGHLTARACGEIATAAAVKRLVPFHFSRRYRANPALIYGEVSAAYRGLIVAPESEVHQARGS